MVILDLFDLNANVICQYDVSDIEIGWKSETGFFSAFVQSGGIDNCKVLRLNRM